jgi:phosphoglycolate phosphatase-like HAD superfamily hydrolase
MNRLPKTSVFLPETAIEIIHRQTEHRPPPEHVLFDFDGTLSLIREGWPEVMIPLMVEELSAVASEEPPEELRRGVERFVMELTGKQTIYQMIRLAEEIEKRGGKPEDPLVYKQRYHERLMSRIGRRREALARGEVFPEAMMVPGTTELLKHLRSRDVSLYLASGTDEHYVREEADLLGLTEFFGPHIHGARDDYRRFSKAKVIERILEEHQVAGEALLGFGDGYVEIENIKQVGGTAVAVASVEKDPQGEPDPWKRERLIEVGADVVIPDYRHGDILLAYLWKEIGAP